MSAQTPSAAGGNRIFVANSLGPSWAWHVAEWPAGRSVDFGQAFVALCGQRVNATEATGRRPEKPEHVCAACRRAMGEDGG